MTQKIVINCKYGGFGLSHQAILRYAEIKKIKLIVVKNQKSGLLPYTYYKNNIKEKNSFYIHTIKRNDPALIQVIEELKEKANDAYANLKIVTIPNNVKWNVHSGEGGIEWIAEKHRTWDGSDD